MLAEAVAPHGGIVMWRAFVYDNNVPQDRAKQAYQEFMPLDGKFNSNVIVQVKNGPVDFQTARALSSIVYRNEVNSVGDGVPDHARVIWDKQRI